MMFSSPMRSDTSNSTNTTGTSSNENNMNTTSSPKTMPSSSTEVEQYQYTDSSLNHAPTSTPSVVSQNEDDDELTLGDQVTRLFRPNHNEENNNNNIILNNNNITINNKDTLDDDDTLGTDGREPTAEDVQKFQSPDGTGPTDTRYEQHRKQFRAMGGAAVVGGVAGMMLLGPIVGLVAAGGAAAAAVAAPGRAGERVRATGEVVAKAGDKIKQLEQEHQIVDKVTHGFTKTATWMSERLEPCYNPQE